FEGDSRTNNSIFLQKYVDEAKKVSKSKLISVYAVKGEDHFSTLALITPYIARKILEDTGNKVNISFTESILKKY
ncbi:MAG: hypothetical protein FWF99_05900, partial [Desulfovibrionaceae bacterium]|nr:hypothetical protein [Desulfovibrionaceae bacterium]